MKKMKAEVSSLKLINSKKMYFLVLIFIYCTLVVLNFLTPLIADDFAYIAKTSGFSSIIHDEYLQYMQQNGRSVAHIMVRFFLLMPKIIFNFVNPLVFLYVVGIIYKMSNFSNLKFGSYRYLLITIAIFLFVPKFGETILWETGAINYLWTFGIMISLLYLYHNKVVNNKNVKIPSFIIFIIGILSGWCNENTSAGTLLLILGYMAIEWKINNKKVENWMKLGLLGEILGFVIMMTSPGNRIRSSWFTRSSWSLPKRFLYGLNDVSNSLSENAVVLIVITLMAIIFCIYLYRNKYNYILGILYFLVGVATCYSLSLSPTGNGWSRSYFGGVMFIIVAFVICFPNLFNLDNFKIVNPIFTTLYVTLLLFTFFNFTSGFLDIINSNNQTKQRYAFIVSEKNKGNMNPEVADFEFYPNTKYPAYSPDLSHIGPDPEYKYNKFTAEYFGVKTVRSIPTDQWKAKFEK